MKNCSIFRWGRLTKRTVAVLSALAVIITALPVVFLSVSAEKSMLANGGFEGGLDGFSTTEKFGGTIVTDVVHGGSNALKVVTVDQSKNPWYDGYVYQAVTVEKNKKYVWSFWFYCDASVTDKAFSTAVRSADGQKLLPSTIKGGGYLLPAFTSFNETRDASNTDNWHKGLTTNAWKEYKITFNSGDNEKVLLTIDAVYSNRLGYTDDWSLTEAVELETGVIRNASFEDGLDGFVYNDKILAESSADEKVTGSKSVKLGAVEGTWNNAFFYQEVAVEKNKKYEWHLWFKSTNNANKPLIGVRTADETKLLPSTLTSDGGYIDPTKASFSEVRSAETSDNWNMGLTAINWSEYVVTFSSGDNETVLLTLNMFYFNRSGWTDDWSLNEKAETSGDLVNGNFEDGTKGYSYSKTTGMVFKTVEDPDLDGNHYLEATGGETRGTGSFYQKVAVKPNTDYKWTLYMKQGPASRSDYTKVTVNTITWGAITTKVKSSSALCDEWGVKPTKKWGAVDVTFNSGTSTEVYLSVNPWASTNTIYTDDWSIGEFSYNLIENASFEKESDNNFGFTLNGITAAQDTTNVVAGDKALKLTGKGTATMDIAVSSYYDYEWSFFVKSSADGKIGFAVATEDGTALLPSSIVKTSGGGTATPESFAENRDNVFANYHKLSGLGSYTQYTVKFSTVDKQKVKICYMTDDDVTVYTDSWYIDGERSFANEELFNPGFEDGTLDTYTGDPLVSASITTDNPHSGSYAAIVTKDDSVGGGNFYQTVKVKPHSNYKWTYWVRFITSSTPIGAEPRKKGGGGVVYSKIEGDADTTVEPSFSWHRMRFADYKWHKYTVVLSTGDYDVIDLSLLAYASESSFATDDWTLEYMGETPNNNPLIDVDFENENMGSHALSKPAWTVTTDEAHGGTHSLQYFGRDATSGSEVLYLDKDGVICDNILLDKNTLYRFSFWYKGTGKLSMANLRFYVYCGGNDNRYANYFGTEDENWHYVEWTFNSEDITTYRFQIAGTLLGSAAYKIFLDDIKLEKLSTGIKDSTLDAEKIVCDDKTNLLPDGTVTASEAGGYWNDMTGLAVVADPSADGGKAVELEKGTEVIKKLQLRPYGEYEFAVSYRGQKKDGFAANAIVGLSFEENGSQFTAGSTYSDTGTSRIIIKNTADFGWVRKGFRFVADEDGIVYLYIKRTGGQVQLDNITLNEITPEPATPKDMTQNAKKEETKKKASIWDSEYNFDFDWNSDDEFDDEPEFEEADIEITEEKENQVPKGKKMMRIKRHKLIKKGNPGIADWIVVLICVGAGVVVAGAALAVIFIILGKKKKKNLKS